MKVYMGLQNNFNRMAGSFIHATPIARNHSLLHRWAGMILLLLVSSIALLPPAEALQAAPLANKLHDDDSCVAGDGNSGSVLVRSLD